MTCGRIPDQHHVARYCSPLHAPDGQIQATAFFIRQGEDSLSVNWLEFFGCPNRVSEIAELRQVYLRKLRRVGQRAMIAVLNVGEVCEGVQRGTQGEKNLEIVHDPTNDENDPSKNDPSHSVINGWTHEDNELIAELILQTILNTYSARN